MQRHFSFTWCGSWLWISSLLVACSSACTIPDMRPPPSSRSFVSHAVDSYLAATTPKFRDPRMAQLFLNTLPNTLDTTVSHHQAAPPDTFIVTGDISAMWLRDSANQVFPYLRFAKNDTDLQTLLKGVVNRHASSVLLDPYANAFAFDPHSAGPHSDDSTSKPGYAGTRTDGMTPFIFERKYEIDSLANVLHFASAYYNATGDLTPFDKRWVGMAKLIYDTFKGQQKSTQEDSENFAYLFQRTTSQPTDSLSHGYGALAARTGLIRTSFRPSDDAHTLPFNIAGNAFAVVAMRGAAHLLSAIKETELSVSFRVFADEVDAAIQKHGVMNHVYLGKVYAYEVDGYGNQYFMDDANLPSLLSMAYYGYSLTSDPIYKATRAGVLSQYNPYFFKGEAAEGTGSPHTGMNYIWPLGIITRALTSEDKAEVAQCLSWLLDSNACTGLLHESFYKDSVQSYSRSWFAWANTFFGQLIMTVMDKYPDLLLK